MSNEIIAALVGVVGTIGGVYFGARLSRQAAQELLVQQAKAEFSSVFTDALVELHTGMSERSENFAHDLLKRHFRHHLKLS